MGVSNNWPQAITFADYLRTQEKKVMHEERRPRINTAADLLGPGLGPRAVYLQDWNADEATFNGIFYSEAGGVINSPDDTAHWIGLSLGENNGYGIQQVWEHRTTPPTLPIRSFRRRFYDPGGGGSRSYTPWEGVNNDTGWLTSGLTYGSDVTNVNTRYRKAGTGLGSTVEVEVRVTYSGANIVVPATGNMPSSVLLCTLPVGFRPADDVRYDVARVASSTMGQVQVGTTGEVRLIAVANNALSPITSGNLINSSVRFIGTDS